MKLSLHKPPVDRLKTDLAIVVVDPDTRSTMSENQSLAKSWTDSQRLQG